MFVLILLEVVIVYVEYNIEFCVIVCFKFNNNFRDGRQGEAKLFFRPH